MMTKDDRHELHLTLSRGRNALCEDLEVKESIEGIPEEDVAAAISYYIFTQCEAQDDWGIDHNSGVFGGWNRVSVSHEGWWASKSHCTKDFLEKLGERCPWVRIF